MFLQILDWLEKFVGLLNDRQKLSLQSNRKKIGKRLVRLHSLLMKIAENAVRIRSQLEKLRADLRTFHGSLDPKGYLAGSPPLSLWSLQHILGEQRVLLNELQKLLRESKELLDVYGGNCGEEIAKITTAKVSLIDLITNLCLYNAPCVLLHFSGWPAAWLPRSFDLNDIDVYRNELQRRLEMDTFLNHQNTERQRLKHLGWENIYESAIALMNKPHNYFAVQLGENRAEAEALLDLLLSQIDSMDAVKRLQVADKLLADIIKTFFKIEELF